MKTNLSRNATEMRPDQQQQRKDIWIRLHGDTPMRYFMMANLLAEEEWDYGGLSDIFGLI